MSAMLPKQPYFILPAYNWIVDSNLTPHILVNAKISGVMVPGHFVKEGKIVLNISMTATKNLHIGENAIEFKARFSGQSYQVYIPLIAIEAIYAVETGEGISFAVYEPSDQPTPPSPDKKPPPVGKPKLYRVK